MSDAWAELQALKSKRDSRRKRLQERRIERQDILNLNSSLGVPQGKLVSSASLNKSDLGAELPGSTSTSASITEALNTNAGESLQTLDKEGSADGTFEDCFLHCFCDAAVVLPIDSRQLLATVNKSLGSSVSHDQIVNLLEKFAVQQLISVEERVSDDGGWLEVVSADHTKLAAMATSVSPSRKRKAEALLEDENGDGMETKPQPEEKKIQENDVLSLLSLASTREKENKRIGEEILELLSRPSIKEKTLAEKFRSQGGTTVRQFCPVGTKSECRKVNDSNKPCTKLHFRKIIQSHTDESLGDCSFLNTCFHMESCKYVHYEVDNDKKLSPTSNASLPPSTTRLPVAASGQLSEDESKAVLHPPQWVHCDLRFFDMTTLGKFSVIMADPPWDIHMNLPYGTMSDDEMRQLNIPALQDEGLIFLWVTGRAMELGRECLQLWGYERVDELIWVKTNQLQRIIRTGRTGHWLNHGKEHCLVGMKGNPPVNRGLDCDVIVAEVRATSHKPDEVYGIIERLSPGTRKIELFGRPHNIQPNWMTLGNQLDGAHLVDEELRSRFYSRYPDGNCMVKPK